MSKHSLRLRIHGWTSAESQILIKHRWPWQESWIQQISSEPQLVPMLSRSGIVFLSRSEDAVGQRLKRNFSKAGVSALVVLMVSSAILLFGSGSAGQKSEQLVRNANSSVTPFVSQQVSCTEELARPTKAIEQWLSGAENSRIQFQELSRQQLGGVQSRVVRISCEQKSNALRLSLRLEQKVWRLNEFVRLED